MEQKESIINILLSSVTVSALISLVVSFLTTFFFQKRKEKIHQEYTNDNKLFLELEQTLDSGSFKYLSEFNFGSSKISREYIKVIDNDIFFLDSSKFFLNKKMEKRKKELNKKREAFEKLFNESWDDGEENDKRNYYLIPFVKEKRDTSREEYNEICDKLHTSAVELNASYINFLKEGKKRIKDVVN